jgi:Tat protein secretion system quality control protein TatD with DNase activity
VNSPLNVIYVVKTMAEVLNIEENKLADQLYQNAIALFSRADLNINQ